MIDIEKLKPLIVGLLRLLSGIWRKKYNEYIKINWSR